MHSLYTNALVFAAQAHGNQKRKYTNEPYIVHPIAVSMLVSSVTQDEEVIAASLLHDVLEDTAITKDELESHFGSRVAKFVLQVTDVSRPEDGNRAKRKKLDLDHLASASANAQTIKVADLIDNTKSIVAQDVKFAKQYLPEKKALLEVLFRADENLLRMAKAQLDGEMKLIFG